MGAIILLLVIVSSALLGSSIPFQPFVDPATQTSGAFNDPSACRPTLNNDNQVRVNVDPSVAHLYTAANPANDPAAGLDFDKTDDEWVLVKKDAPIPAWKVLLRTRDRDGTEVAEMERIGTAEGLTLGAQTITGNDVYIGTGWCNPADGENWGWPEDTGNPRGHEYCLDPLTQDTIFVLSHQGATDIFDPFIDSFDWPISNDPQPPRTQENLDKYFWKFDVYYKKAKLPANPTTEDLPCWIERQCYANLDVQDAIHAERRFERAADGSCEIVRSEYNADETLAQTTNQKQDQSVLGFNAQAQETTAILSKSEMVLTNPPADITMTNTYLFSSQLSIPPDPGGMDELIGTINSPLGNPEFNIYLRRGNVAGEDVDHAIIIDPAPAGDPDGPYFMYVPILDNSRPDAKSLQLGSFLPGIPSYFYEWWTPSCKPALYLYPEKETELSVVVKPNGHITESIPEHGVHGWNITAHPDGTIVETNPYSLIPEPYPYLYYEAAIKNVEVPKDTGWIKTTKQLPVFFADVLPKLGLNTTEAQDFLEYWLPKLEDEGDRWFITLIDEDEVNRTEPVEFSVKPDNFHRIRFYFENIDNKPLFTRPNPYSLNPNPYSRSGFTVIDWGGIIGNGSCGLEEVAQ